MSKARRQLSAALVIATLVLLVIGLSVFLFVQEVAQEIPRRSLDDVTLERGMVAAERRGQDEMGGELSIESRAPLNEVMTHGRLRIRVLDAEDKTAVSGAGITPYISEWRRIPSGSVDTAIEFVQDNGNTVLARVPYPRRRSGESAEYELVEDLLSLENRATVTDVHGWGELELPNLQELVVDVDREGYCRSRVLVSTDEEERVVLLSKARKAVVEVVASNGQALPCSGTVILIEENLGRSWMGRVEGGFASVTVPRDTTRFVPRLLCEGVVQVWPVTVLELGVGPFRIPARPETRIRISSAGRSPGVIRYAARTIVGEVIIDAGICRPTKDSKDEGRDYAVFHGPYGLHEISQLAGGFYFDVWKESYGGTRLLVASLEDLVSKEIKLERHALRSILVLNGSERVEGAVVRLLSSDAAKKYGWSAHADREATTDDTGQAAFVILAGVESVVVAVESEGSRYWSTVQEEGVIVVNVADYIQLERINDTEGPEDLTVQGTDGLVVWSFQRDGKFPENGCALLRGDASWSSPAPFEVRMAPAGEDLRTAVMLEAGFDYEQFPSYRVVCDTRSEHVEQEAWIAEIREGTKRLKTVTFVSDSTVSTNSDWVLELDNGGAVISWGIPYTVDRITTVLKAVDGNGRSWFVNLDPRVDGDVIELWKNSKTWNVKYEGSGVENGRLYVTSGRVTGTVAADRGEGDPTNSLAFNVPTGVWRGLLRITVEQGDMFFGVSATELGRVPESVILRPNEMVSREDEFVEIHGTVDWVLRGSTEANARFFSVEGMDEFGVRQLRRIDGSIRLARAGNFAARVPVSRRLFVLASVNLGSYGQFLVGESVDRVSAGGGGASIVFH